jgi:hypothetical protein
MTASESFLNRWRAQQAASRREQKLKAQRLERAEQARLSEREESLRCQKVLESRKRREVEEASRRKQEEILAQLRLKMKEKAPTAHPPSSSKLSQRLRIPESVIPHKRIEPSVIRKKKIHLKRSASEAGPARIPVHRRKPLPEKRVLPRKPGLRFFAKFKPKSHSLPTTPRSHRQEKKPRSLESKQKRFRFVQLIKDSRQQVHNGFQRAGRWRERLLSSLRERRRLHQQKATGAQHEVKESPKKGLKERTKGKKRTAEGLAPARIPTAVLTAKPIDAVREREPERLSWLKVKGNRLLDENEKMISLRGFNLAGLNRESLSFDRPLREMLALDEQNLSVIAEDWKINIVRLPFLPHMFLDGTSGLSAAALWGFVDEIVDSITTAGIYTLLACEPPAGSVLPGDEVFECWQRLAVHFQDVPGVLFEIYSTNGPLPPAWPENAGQLIGVIRREHPASLIFVGGVGGGRDLTGLPLRFATGSPIHNLVYTVRLGPQEGPSRINPRVPYFVQAYPLFASVWTDSYPDLGRSADLAGGWLERLGIGWTACNWNAEPRLVINAAKHDFTPTRFGRVARRLLAT